MKAKWNRRDFIKLAGLATATVALPNWARGEAKAEEKPPVSGELDFVFFTDTHLQPELGGDEGCRRCFAEIAKLKPSFAVCGGDLVFDALEQKRERAETLYAMYRSAEQTLGVPVYHTVGNHDIFGVVETSGVPVTDPEYGKKLFEDRVGATRYSFDRDGYHFVVLDSIVVTPDRAWEARIDQAQLAWLRADFEKAGRAQPVIVVTHVPLVSAIQSFHPPSNRPPSPHATMTVANASEVLSIFEPYRVVAVLQGHTHINETVVYKGIHYITSGAVCGNWWKGPRWGFSEGFTRIRLRGDRVETEYVTYGWKAVGAS